MSDVSYYSRRHFLRSAGTAAGFLALGGLLQACGGGAAPSAAASASGAAPANSAAASTPASSAAASTPASSAAASTPASASPAASSAAASGAGGKEVVFGAIYPLSGSSAPTGLDLKDGVDLAVEIINTANPNLSALPLAAAAGLPGLGGAKLKVVYGDHQSDPTKGASEAERLVTQEHVVALIGCYQSNITQTASQRAEQLHIPFVNPESTSPSLTERGYKWFFRSTATDATFTEMFFQFLRERDKQQPFPSKKVAIFHENTLFGSDVAKYSKQFASTYGFQVTTEVGYAPNASDLTSEVQRLKAGGEPVLIQASYIADATLSIKTYQQLGYLPQMILAQDAGFVDSAFVKNVGKNANDLMSREVWALDLASKKPIVKTVNDMFKAKYKNNMNGNSARSFTGVFVLADAINRAKS
ncbi:MAG: ABC transporter substrate-binding protein, partial [Chloroflexota bacterium]